MGVGIGLIAGVADDSPADADNLVAALPLLNKESASVASPQSELLLHLFDNILMALTLVRLAEAIQAELVEAARAVEGTLLEYHSSLAALQKTSPVMNILLIFLILFDVFDAF